MFQKLIESEAAQVLYAHFSAIIQVFIVHVFAVALTFTNINDWLKTGGLAVALAFGLWKWFVEIRREKRLRKLEKKADGNKD